MPGDQWSRGTRGLMEHGYQGINGAGVPGDQWSRGTRESMEQGCQGINGAWVPGDQWSRGARGSMEHGYQGINGAGEQSDQAVNSIQVFISYLGESVFMMGWDLYTTVNSPPSCALAISMYGSDCILKSKKNDESKTD